AAALRPPAAECARPGRPHADDRRRRVLVQEPGLVPVGAARRLRRPDLPQLRSSSTKTDTGGTACAHQLLTRKRGRTPFPRKRGTTPFSPRRSSSSLSALASRRP